MAPNGLSCRESPPHQQPPKGCSELYLTSPSTLPLSRRYGFDYGCIHFVLMSTEHAFDPASPQYTFLEDHLRSVDRSVTPWLVFAGHRPMYIDSTNAAPVSGDLTVAKLLRESLEPLLVVSAGCSVL